ncbi:cystathionine gamma-lyase cys3 [Thecaphora frezii]
MTLPPLANRNANGHASSSSSSSSSSAAASLNGHHADAYNGFSTKAIHVGSEPNAATGAVIPPISLSSTFAQDGVGNHKGYEYSRSSNPNRDSFERAVAAIENGKRGLAFSSGSAGTATILNSLPAGSHVVSVNDVYGGTHRYFTKVATASQGIQTSFVEMDGDKDAVKERVNQAIRKDTSLVWIETPTNPTLRVIDVPLIVSLVRSHPLASPDVKIVVDNTFMSPWFQNPLDLGADLVLHSVTKYINGHSDVVMGVAVLNDDAWADRLAFLQNAIGAVPSPFDCWLALRGLKTLSLRMKAHGESALAIAQYLESHPAIERVIYPGLASHPGHEVARRQVTKRARSAHTASTENGAFPYGGMVSFRLKVDPANDEPADKVLSNLRIFTLAESLGGVESLIELPSKMTHGGIPLEDRIRLGIGHNLIRVSVGLEETADLIEDLRQAIEAAGL